MALAVRNTGVSSRSSFSSRLFQCVVAMALLLQATTADPGPGHYGGVPFGSLVLCPPGGPNFMMAWSLACEMKRRRKRSTDGDHAAESSLNKLPSSLTKKRKRMAAGYRPATLSEIQKICCNVGCEIRDLVSYCDPFGPWNSR